MDGSLAVIRHRRWRLAPAVPPAADRNQNDRLVEKLMRRTSLTDVGFMKKGEHDGDGLNLRAHVSLGRDLSVGELPHVGHWPIGRDRAREV
jgi:hypothetical protein